MHPELDHFIRQFVGTVLATIMPLVFLVFLHTPEHLIPATGSINIPTVQQTQNEAS
ncbi:hypothetical protein [Chromobacterium alticapitis]|uniref:hypothetical protein n=1 Tax=Chromobacterium alticapitis TaxID=2073169 RepID=UPI001304F644|nr:hypothetical protein [Chromobacterium alticapitis]